MTSSPAAHTAALALVALAGCSRDWDAFRRDAAPGADASVGPAPDAALAVRTGEVLAHTFANTTVAGYACVIENLDLAPGHIVVDCPNTLIRNVRVRSDSYYAITNGGAAEPFVVEHAEVDCHGGQGFDGVGQRNLTVRWTYVHDCGSGVRVEGAAHVADSKVVATDGFRLDGQGPVVVERCEVASRGGNSAVFVNGDPALTVTLTSNLLAGGGYTVYFGSRTNYDVRDNRFVRGSYDYAPFSVAGGARAGRVWEANRFADNGEALAGP